MEFDPVCATHGSYAEVLTLSHLRYPVFHLSKQHLLLGGCSCISLRLLQLASGFWVRSKMGVVSNHPPAMRGFIKKSGIAG